MHKPDSTNIADSVLNHPISIRLKIPPASMVRRSSRVTPASGSEYHASEKSEHSPQVMEEEEEPKVEFDQTRFGRKVKKRTYVESSDGEEDKEESAADLFNVDNDRKVDKAPPKRSRQRLVEGPEVNVRRSTRGVKARNVEGFIDADDEEEDAEGTYGQRIVKPHIIKSNGTSTSRKKTSKQPRTRPPISSRRTRSNPGAQDAEDDFQPQTSSPASGSADGSMDDAQGSSDLEIQPEPEPEPEPEEDEADDGKPYSLRQRQPVNYAIPPPLEDMPAPPRKAQGRNARTGHGAASKKRNLGWSATGAELGKWMGMPADDSDSDYPTRTPRKPYGGLGPFGAGAVPAGGMLPGEFAAGTPSNLGKIGDSSLADADPLGVNQNVTFDEVGGLDDHIHALKEMTLLPLLYPEVFQRFNVTPPRGVLFHGPPGTGKTLLARALAASCRSGGRQISFFMRKGADCLSKWVGEAERQLRLLFEEARNCQPSIIFFDEIDGLAPVRSSKQDQIHASIVSTLLALMDGMDGRGQVVVVGATNRPDAVDPALRRPGRFDREFYFGLPGLEAREKILSIMTRKWHGWGGAEEDKTEEKESGVAERVKGLAKLTKGYGGADLRALCTEAALNAIQRRYPQVYKSNDRLLLKPETIGVGLRDFMISIKKLVPSSARSSTSAASPLPSQFQPLLGDVLEKVKGAVQRVLPLEKKLSALEEAEFEDIGGEEGALEKEMLSQAMQTLRVYRPRIAIHGCVGMGQEYIGAAALHHLEGYHIQSLELGTLMGDSTRTVEAAIVQVFVEAKRHQPSVLYIPSLIAWCATISETSRSTIRAMLDTLAPTDPILLLAVVDGQFSDLPRDVKAWFCSMRDNRVELVPPTASQREEFFEGLLKDIQRPPNQFSDGVQRKKRVLEVLPIAPPLEPREPTAAELALQEENDQKVVTLLKYRLGPILTELKRKFKRFTKRAAEDYNIDPQDSNMNGLDTFATTIIETQENPNGLTMDLTNDQAPQLVNGENGPHPNGHVVEQQQLQLSLTLYDMDLERMQSELWKGRYLTPQDFMDDIGKIVHNANVRFYDDSDRLYKAQAMFTAAQVSIQEFDPQFRLECERMAARERQRREERRKERGKDKGKEPAAPVIIRRSARANGLQPEHPITDPVKLERRLKRQRGEIDGNGGDSHTSEGESHGLPIDGSRDVKRSRMLDEQDDDRDPLDTLDQTPGSEARTHVVRFLTAPIEPMAPLITIDEHPHPQHDTHRPSFPRHPSPLQNELNNPQHVESMPVDSMPLRPFGFNPALLNPMSPSENPFQATTPPFSQRIPAAPANPAMVVDPSDPFISQPHPQHPYLGPLSPNASTSYPQIPRGLTLAPVSVQPSPAQSRRTSRHPTPLPGPSISTEPPEPVPMEIERTPTPLPDFHVSSTLVNELRRFLRDLTADLTIEQLEQLRATSLGTVWRHRKEWDRDELIRALLKDAKSFVNDVLEALNSEY